MLYVIKFISLLVVLGVGSFTLAKASPLPNGDPIVMTPEATWRTGEERTRETYIGSTTKSAFIGASGSVQLCATTLGPCIKVSGTVGVRAYAEWEKWKVEEQWEVCRYPTAEDDLEVGETLVCYWQTVQSYTAYRNVRVHF